MIMNTTMRLVLPTDRRPTKVYCCPVCGGAIIHVTDDIFRCPACRWNGPNVAEKESK